MRGALRCACCQRVCVGRAADIVGVLARRAGLVNPLGPAHDALESDLIALAQQQPDDADSQLLLVYVPPSQRVRMSDDALGAWVDAPERVWGASDRRNSVPAWGRTPSEAVARLRDQG